MEERTKFRNQILKPFAQGRWLEMTIPSKPTSTRHEYRTDAQPGRRLVKTISVRDLKKRIRSVVETAQNDQVVIARHGQPIAVVVGAGGCGLGDGCGRDEPVLLEEARPTST